MPAHATVDFAKAGLSHSLNVRVFGLVPCPHSSFFLQFWTALYWVTTVDLLVRHFGMTAKVGFNTMPSSVSTVAHMSALSLKQRIAAVVNLECACSAN